MRCGLAGGTARAACDQTNFLQRCVATIPPRHISIPSAQHKPRIVSGRCSRELVSLTFVQSSVLPQSFSFILPRGLHESAAQRKAVRSRAAQSWLFGDRKSDVFA
jgi:hypothetical protein